MNTNPGTYIESTGTYMPPQIVSSEEIFDEFRSESYGYPRDWMSKNMGIKERRVADSTQLPSDLAILASQDALANVSEKNLDEINLILFCGIERDNSEPSTAHSINHALGLEADHAFDISDACFGFFRGIQVASQFIAGGLTKSALITTGEVPSRIMYAAIRELQEGVDKTRAANIIGALSVGDAGGAIVLKSNEDRPNLGFKGLFAKTDSSRVKQCYYRPDNSSMVGISGQMEMAKIVGASVHMHRKIINGTLRKLEWDKFDWMLMHQTGKRPFEKFSSFSTVSQRKIIKTFDKFGNIASATFPVTFKILCETGKVRKNDRAGGMYSGSGLVVGEFGYQF